MRVSVSTYLKPAVQFDIISNRHHVDGFRGLVVSMLVPEFAGSNPAEVVGFFGHLKNPPHAFLRR